MNEPLPPDVPQNPDEDPVGDSPDLAEPTTERTRPHWLKRCLACNPFYLVSAALLLYGFYRISIDSSFLKEETAHLLFNFASLQIYELLLVVTAIFLAARRIWYDSTLLVGLENLLILVPFILISQAALISINMIWTMCLLGGITAVARSGSLKRLIAELNLPLRLLAVGLVMLALNVAFPVIYRLLHEHKVGTRLEAGPAYFTNEYAWLILMPVLCGLERFLIRSRSTGELLPQRRWLPPGLYTLWLLGTGVHLYCLGYVYDFALRLELLAPAVWMLVWISRQWTMHLVPGLSKAWRRALLPLPAAATLLGVSQIGDEVFLVLTMLNAAVYARMFAKSREEPLALHLALISLAALVAGLPENWVLGLGIEFSRMKCVCAGGAGYLVLLAALSRHPGMGIFGGLLSATGLMVAFGDRVQVVHWATQAGLAFLLMHSLRWEDALWRGARTFRVFASAIWVAHTILWIHAGAESWMACAVVTPVLGSFLAARLLIGRWGPLVVPLAAVLVALAGPGHSAGDSLQTAPVGLVAIIGSFLLFALGTVAALTKHRWYHCDSKP